MASNGNLKTAGVEVEDLAGMPPVQLPPPEQSNAESSPPASTSQPNRWPHPTEIYKLPAPVKTFPLPTFYASNPLGAVWIAYKWISHLLFTPNEPSVIHSAIWSPGSSSVHVVDAQSMRALWEQGFYGKGSLSRSEPEWTKRRLAQQGQGGDKTSAEVTEARRVARQQKKWERARLEQEAIRKQREEEARQAAEAEQNMRENAISTRDVENEWTAPVGPLELLRMPNSNSSPDGFVSVNGHAHESTNGKGINGHTTTPLKGGHDFQTGIVEDLSPIGSVNGVSNGQGLKKQKSVRFSPTVESATFLFHDPPSPQHTAVSSPRPQAPLQVPAKTVAPADDDHFTYFNEMTGETVKVAQTEHLQLTPAEAFFLAFGLGALVVKDPQTNKKLTIEDLFDCFRRYSYFPPRIQPAAELGPDDPFLLQYAAYHHFRSLGWVPRPGVKFGVDWLLYLRGPVFDHAQFAVLVLPEYEDPAWREHGKAEGTGRSWTWFFGVNRVISQVHKKLVLAYVYVPPPERFEAARRRAVGEAMALYKVREIMVSRWSTNRNR